MQKRLDLDTVSDTAPAVIGAEQRFDLNSVSDTPIDSCEHSDYCTSCLCSRWNINCLCRNIITQNQTIYNNISQRAKCLCLRAGGVRTCYASTLFPEQTMATSSNELDSEVRGLDHQPTPLNLNEAPHMSGDRDDFQLQLYNYTQYKNQMAQNVFDCDTYCACDNDVASTIRDLREIGNLAKPCNATVPNLADPTQYEVTIEDLGNEQQSESSESLVAGKSPKKANSRNQPTYPDFRTPHERKTDKNQTKKQKKLVRQGATAAATANISNPTPSTSSATQNISNPTPSTSATDNVEQTNAPNPNEQPSPRARKPPPITVIADSSEQITKALATANVSFKITCVGGKLKIFPATPNDHHLAMTVLAPVGLEMHTHDLRDRTSWTPLGRWDITEFGGRPQ